MADLHRHPAAPRGIPTLPSGAAAHALERERIAALSDAEMTSIDFGPWPLAGMCHVPTDDQWKQDGKEVLGFLRLASHLVTLDKAALVDGTADLPPKDLDALLKALPKWAYRFRTLEALTETAHARLMVAVAVLAKEAAAGRRARPPIGARRRATASQGGAR